MDSSFSFSLFPRRQWRSLLVLSLKEELLPLTTLTNNTEINNTNNMVTSWRVCVYVMYNIGYIMEQGNV